MKSEDSEAVSKLLRRFERPKNILFLNEILKKEEPFKKFHSRTRIIIAAKGAKATFDKPSLVEKKILQNHYL